MKKLFCMIALLCAMTAQADAQDLKSILSGIAKSVVGDKATTAATIVGAWSYAGPACRFESDDVLSKVGGEAASSAVEEKLESVYATLGMNTIRYTFNEDNTCSYTLKGKTVEGTYTFDAEAKTLTITTGRLKVKTVAHVVTLGENMSFVFKADKLMSILKTITGAASKVNSTAATLNSLAGNYDGLMLGFELKKQ